MKRNVAIYLLLAGMLLSLSGVALAERPKHRGPVKGGAAPSGIQVQNQFTLTGNNWAFECTNYGSYAQDIAGRLPNSGGSGGEFPRGTETYIIYAAGIQVGAMVNGVPHVSVVDFDSEFQPGPLFKSNPYDSTEVPTADDPGSVINKLFALDGAFQDGTPSGTNGDDLDDYANWPAQYGAPVDPDGKPLVIGDLMSWCVFNDMDATRHVIPDNSQKEPLGLEIQQTSIQVNISGYSEVFFMYYRLINKGTKNLKEVYVSAWFDADVDKSSNDLVATDTAANMVFTYNSDNSDPKSLGGSAFGADFFQGPVVPGEPTDTAKYLELTPFGFVAHAVPGKKVMGLSTTVRYINVRGPDGDPDNDAELYNLMRGREKNGDAKASRWAYPDDPITGSVLDPRPDDKRMMLVTGPFDLSVGDTQIVVLACVGANAADRIEAIRALRTTDEIAQQAYDAAFILPQPPTSPRLTATALDHSVSLQWDNSPELGVDTYPQKAHLNISGYRGDDFAGYKLYKSTNEGKTWKMLQQYDRMDGVTVIPETTWFVQGVSIKTMRQVPIGGDNGLQYSYIDEDVIPLKEYRYAVTAYDAQPDIRSGAAPITLESAKSRNAVRIIPRSATAGNVNDASVRDTAVHMGPSGGSVLATVVDPTKVTGHTYKVVFENVQIIDTTASDTSHKLVWKLWDQDLGAFVRFFKADDPRTDVDESMFQERQASASDAATQKEFVTVDGLQLQVFGPANDFVDFLVMSNASGPLDPPDYGAFAFNSSNFPHPTTGDRPSDLQQVGGGHWGIHTADNGSRITYSSFISRTTRDGANWPEIVPYDFEIRFTAAGGWGFDAYNSGTASFQVPFELWNIGIGTPNDPSDDYRMIPWLLDDDGSLSFNMGAPGSKSSGTYDHSISGGDNDPYTDWIYWTRPANPVPGDAGYRAAEALMQAGTYDGGTEEEVMARMVLVNWNGDTSETPPSGLYNQPLPETGTVFRIITAKPNSTLDTFTVQSTAKPAFSASLAESKLNKQNIKVVPNPYYGFAAYDLNQFNRRVKITGLPAECTIRIYNVAGDLVRTLEHSAGTNNDRSRSTTPEYTSVEVWDLTSNNGLFVSSGVYFIHIDAPGIGKSEELIPFAIIQGNIQLTVPTN